MKYRIEFEPPKAEEYCHLRISAGMTPKDPATARFALARSLFMVSVREPKTGRLIGMGRVIGDFTALQIVDIAVDPRHHEQKIGYRVMNEIMAYIRDTAPKTCFVNLFSDIDYLYEPYGFVKPEKTQGLKLDWDTFKKRNSKCSASYLHQMSLGFT